MAESGPGLRKNVAQSLEWEWRGYSAREWLIELAVIGLGIIVVGYSYRQSHEVARLREGHLAPPDAAFAADEPATPAD